MTNYGYDRNRLLAIVGASCEDTREGLCEAERLYRQRIVDGKDTDYWRLILLALLSGDRDKLRAACDEACEAREGALSVNISKAYCALRRAKTSRA